MDYREFYDLESYLFDIVGPRFHDQGYLTAFDLFCIVIWKANRAKSRIAKKLLGHGSPDLEAAARELTEGLAQRNTPESRLQYLFEFWGLALPMASAVLTVLYPDEFTIYDARVRETLGFTDLTQITRFEALWPRYQEFKRAVEEATPAELSLRDKDRYLWGQSFHQQLVQQLGEGFVAADANS